MARDGLTEKQKRFIDEYIKTGNQTEAARLAGYKQPHVQGNRLLENVREKIDERLERIEDSRIADMIEINRFWSSVIRGEIMEEKAAYNPDTGAVETVQTAPAIRDRIKAAELRAKVQGAFIERVEIREVESEWFKG